VLTSVQLDPALVQRGTTQSSLWVFFSSGLPPEGAVVTFASSNPQIATIPSPVTIPGFSGSGLLPVFISPTAVGVATLSATWNGVTVSAPLTVTATSLLRITTDSVLPNARIGENYAGFIEACCGQGGPISWSLVSGSVPAGLRFAGNALRLVQNTGVTGVATRVQTTSFTVRARDAAGNTATKTFSLTVDPASPLIVNNGTDRLTDGKVGVAYATGLFPLGGTPPWSWSLVGGQLPPGLSVQASPGRVLGTPTTAGTFTFTVRVADSAGQTASQQFSITVLP
jgi:Putative Ig domain